MHIFTYLYISNKIAFIIQNENQTVFTNFFNLKFESGIFLANLFKISPDKHTTISQHKVKWQPDIDVKPQFHFTLDILHKLVNKILFSNSTLCNVTDHLIKDQNWPLLFGLVSKVTKLLSWKIFHIDFMFIVRQIVRDSLKSF